MQGNKMSKDDKELVAKELVSLVVAQVRKGRTRTRALTIKKKLEKELLAVPATAAEVTEQLRQFENMVIIQRLDTLIDMQKIQWEILNKLAGLIETMRVVGSDPPATEDDDDDEYTDPASTATIDELIQAHEEATRTSADSVADQQYEKAEEFGRFVSKVKNDVN